MKWIRASERLPETRQRGLVVKCENKSGGIWRNIATYDPDKIYAGSNWDKDDVFEWLDESPQSEQEDELWNEVEQIILHAGVPRDVLKSKFTISKKQ